MLFQCSICSLVFKGTGSKWTYFWRSGSGMVCWLARSWLRFYFPDLQIIFSYLFARSIIFLLYTSVGLISEIAYSTFNFEAFIFSTTSLW
jgi:hypothetical protein